MYVWNDIRKIWQPGKVVDIPNPVREQRTYTVLLNSKFYRRTREHLKPRVAANNQRDDFERNMNTQPSQKTQAPEMNIDKSKNNSTVDV